MSVVNGGFETAGTELGEADGWTVVYLATAERIHPMDGSGRNTFESGWGNDVHIDEFTTELTAHTASPETFESGWNNDAYALSFAGSAHALNTDGFEGDSWNVNALGVGGGPYIFEFTTELDAHALNTDGFESGWNNDSDVGWDLAATFEALLTAKTFGTAAGAGTATRENFEDVSPGEIFIVNSSNDTLASLLGASLTNGDAVRVTSTGTLPAGLGEDVDYVVAALAGNLFKLEYAGQTVAIGDLGSGTHTIYQALELYWKETF